jgi:hypothetical protein
MCEGPLSQHGHHTPGKSEGRLSTLSRPPERVPSVRFDPLAHALNDEGASGRVVEPAWQDLLVFRRVVPALERSFVGEFQDDDAFGLRLAFDQFGRAGPRQETAAILLDRRAGAG